MTYDFEVGCTYGLRRDPCNRACTHYFLLNRKPVAYCYSHSPLSKDRGELRLWANEVEITKEEYLVYLTHKE